MGSVDIEEVLDLIGFGRIQFFMLIVCGIICITVSNEIIGINILLVPIATEFEMTDTQRSQLTSAAFLGMILCSHFSGYKADVIGRRKMMLYSVVGTAVFSNTSAAMPNFYLFLLMRFVTGLFITGASMINISYLSEFTPRKSRPRMVNFMSYFIALGSIYVPSMAYFLSPMDRILCSIGTFDLQMWRLVIVINTTPAFVAFIAILLLPESAKFLLSKGNHEQAYDTLNRLSKTNRGEDLQSLDVSRIHENKLATDQSGQNEKKCLVVRMWHDTVPLFKRPYVKYFVLVTFLLSGFFFVGNGLLVWFMQLRQRMSDSELTICEMLQENAEDEISLHKCANSSSHVVNYMDGIIMGFCILLGFIFISVLLICIPRRRVIFICLLTATLTGFSLNFFHTKLTILIAFSAFIAVCASSIGICASVLCDIVPTHLRGKAVCLGFMFARLAVIVASTLIGAFICSHCLMTYNIFVVYIGVCMAFSCLLPL